MRTRTVSLIVLVLAVLCTTVFFVSTWPTSEATDDGYNASSDEEPFFDFASGILSRLSMFPGMRTKPVPVAVIVENHEVAREYHRGLTDALMIQEYMVEGFISRFLVLFDSRKLPRTMGPVRSLRPYFLDGMAPWTRTVFHAGGSPEALSRVGGDMFTSVNLLRFDGTGSMRANDVPAPHNLFISRDQLLRLLADVREDHVQPVAWPSYEYGLPAGGAPATKIDLDYFSSTHDISYEFLPLAGKYVRLNGIKVSDARPANVILLEIPIDSIGEHGRLFMTTTGKGKAQVFHSGKVWEAEWSRDSIEKPYRFTDADGNDIPLSRGLVWMTILPSLDERVEWL